MEEFANVLDKVRADPEVVRLFFAVFARFEYALKMTPRYAKNTRGDGVEANWDLLAGDLSPYFDPARTPELLEAKTFLVTKPPHKQVLIVDKLEWADRPLPVDDPILLTLVNYIRRMRNNLFHGGKQQGGTERNTALLRKGLIVLHECLTLCRTNITDVYHHFQVS